MASGLLLSPLLVVLILLALLVFLFFEKRKGRELAAQLGVALQETNLYKEKLNILSEAAFEGIVLLEDGLCLLMNSRAEEIFGYKASDVVGRPTTILIADTYREEVRRNIDNQYDAPYEVEGLRRDGTKFPLAIYGKSLEYRGRVVRAAALRDLTLWKQRDAERLTLEVRLERSRKMESIGLMAGGVAHDLNNILSGLVTYPEFLLMGLKKDDPLYEPLTAIHDAGERATGVVADLLTVARGAAMEIRPVDLNELVRSYLKSPEYDHLQQNHPDVSFRTQLDEQILHIGGSAVHVGKCLMNLVTNGAEAIQGRGTVTVRTGTVLIDEQQGRELDLKPGVFSVLEIHDSGSGISLEDQAHIFEPFYSRKVIGRSGTGLGLAVVWNTMKNHGGCVHLESGDDGTTFRLYFRVTQHEGEIVLEEGPELVGGNGETILVVDDDPHQRIIALKILEGLGYRVETVQTGEGAVSWLQQHDADLILLDMLLGRGMNGYETYREILHFRPGQKAIIASGYSGNSEVHKALKSGAGMYIKKPYGVCLLGKAISEVLRE